MHDRARTGRSCYEAVTLTVAALITLAAAVPAQLQFDELPRRVFPADSDYTYAAALGDIDGDDDLDMVFGTSRQNRLYLNDGSGTYTDATAQFLPADSASNAVALGDVDGDGDLDIIFGSGRQQNRLYLNDGTGTYTDVTTLRMPVDDSDETSAVALGDVDGDGDLDAVFGNGRYSGRHQNRLYLNDGGGTYTDVTAARMPADADFTVALAIGDVDGDGDLDMVFGTGTNGQNRLYLNDGSGTYTDGTAQLLPVDSDSTGAVAMGDIDDDGDLDIVLGNIGQNRLYLNDGSGTYADLTEVQLPAESDGTRTMALHDIDGDGDLDVVFGNSGQNRLCLNDGSGTFTDATEASMPAAFGSSFAVVLGDVDSDDDLDMVFGNINGQRDLLYLNDGRGTYSDATESRMPVDSHDTRAVGLGDVDRDGDLDLVSANVGQNRLYLNNGTGAYTEATAELMPAASNLTFAVALGDIDGDGDLDMVLGNTRVQPFISGDRQNRLYLNDGTGTYTDATAARMPTDGDDTSAVALGDVDGDGDLDMVFGNGSFAFPYPGRQNRLYLNDGNGTYTDATAQLLPADGDITNAVVLGDVDGDGDLDMVLGNSWNDSNMSAQSRLYLNDGTGTYTDATEARLPADSDATVAIALGDVEGDGDLDMVFGSSSWQQNRLYLNDGSGTYTDATAQLPLLSDRTHAVALGDTDGDGDLDLISGNLGQQNLLYLNDGSGTYTDVTAARMLADKDSTFAMALGDVDADGDLDMVLGTGWRNRLYLNLLRQLDTPFFVKPGREYRLEAYARYGPPRPGDIAFAFISTGRASIPLPSLGTIGIDLSRSAELPPFFIPQPTGMGSVSFTVPNQPHLIGVSVYAQALLLPFGGPWRLTNVTADQIVR